MLAKIIELHKRRRPAHRRHSELRDTTTNPAEPRQPSDGPDRLSTERPKPMLLFLMHP
jgi:hypothetical protein